MDNQWHLFLVFKVLYVQLIIIHITTVSRLSSNSRLIPIYLRSSEWPWYSLFCDVLDSSATMDPRCASQPQQTGGRYPFIVWMGPCIVLQQKSVSRINIGVLPCSIIFSEDTVHFVVVQHPAWSNRTTHEINFRECSSQWGVSPDKQMWRPVYPEMFRRLHHSAETIWNPLFLEHFHVVQERSVPVMYTCAMFWSRNICSTEVGPIVHSIWTVSDAYRYKFQDLDWDARKRFLFYVPFRIFA